jgi:hypothetical protein
MFEEEFVLSAKRKMLREQLGVSAKFLMEVVPSLEMLIGKLISESPSDWVDKPTNNLEGLSPTELQHCLIRAFSHFFRILSGIYDHFYCHGNGIRSKCRRA